VFFFSRNFNFSILPDDACPVIHWVSLETNESERFEKMKRL
jgi:hypothetical protein